MGGFLMEAMGSHEPVNATCAIRMAGLAEAELSRRQVKLLNPQSYRISSSSSQ